jgi:hypothetical protein
MAIHGLFYLGGTMRKIILFFAAVLLLVSGTTDYKKPGHDFIRHHRVVG